MYVVKNNRTKNTLQNRWQNTLSDSIIDRMWASLLNIFGAYLPKAISTLTYRINWNKGSYCYVISCLAYEDVKAIVTIYINLVKDGKIPEYDRKNNPDKINFIENEVEKIYGKNIADVKTTLYELYYATLDGMLSTDEFLRPKTFEKNIDYKNNPDLQGNQGGVEGFINSVYSTLKTLIWILILAGIGYAGYYVYNLLKETKVLK
jgi:hypothetical protein